MYERGVPTDANIWDGLKFHWKMEEIELALPDGKVRKIIQLMPTKFLGGHENHDEDQEFEQMLETTQTHIRERIKEGKM